MGKKPCPGCERRLRIEVAELKRERDEAVARYRRAEGAVANLARECVGWAEKALGLAAEARLATQPTAAELAAQHGFEPHTVHRKIGTEDRQTGPACQKCDGHGWLWAHELTEYHGDNDLADETRYDCDVCGGTGIVATE